MKSKGKKIIIGLGTILIIIGLGIWLYVFMNNPNRISSDEKHYMANNANVVQNINILNNVNVFGQDGSGVFYDFISDFQDKYGLQINNVAFSLGESTQNNVTLTAGNTLDKTDKVFYQDHYVLVAKEKAFMEDAKNIKGLNIGVVKEDKSFLSSSLTNIGEVNLIEFDNREDLIQALKDNEKINYMLVPLTLYVDTILSDNLYVIYHFSDLSYYYKISEGNNAVLASIMSKFYSTWSEDYLTKYYNDYLFNMFVSALKISQTDIDTMKGKDYNYGFVTNKPYEILASSNYGGIVAQYLKDFSDFSGVEFKFTKYKTYNKLVSAINNKNVDLYFGYYNIGGYTDINSNIAVLYEIIAPKKKNIIISSLSSLTEEVYVEENSILASYLSNNTKLNIKTYKNTKELKKLVRNKKIIIIDKNQYEAQKYDMFDKYNVRYSGSINRDYKFKINSDNVFTSLFTRYLNIKDNHDAYFKGLYNYEVTLKNGTISGTIAKYFMYVLIAVFIIFLYFYHVSKKVKVSKRIKKEDKLKYIDQLTSLKNRNYLSENLENWSKNTIYPQTIIVIDLNNLQYINDTMGYEKGDTQIKAAANILVKNQLDNSDIIRTDGNEFVIYLIGYQTKQITSYIHKLTKEFKNLPYEYGAAISYSMITDDIKSVEDAINEAVEAVKKQKQNKKEE